MSDAGELHLGERLDLANGEAAGPLTYDRDDLTTHGVIVGMTGSGKTGLAVVLLEEALASGIPALILDPKGDMPNLLLNFPEFRAADFEPWVNEGDAKNAGMAVPDFAAAQAESWRSGLAGAGITPDRMRALRDGIEFNVFTPGSTTGRPLNIVGDLAAPASADAESLREEAAALVTGLLSLVGIEGDPLASREHILLANIVESAWAAGRDLDLPSLIGAVLTPPFRKLGVFELDSFFPEVDRRALAMRLNGLVASPSFAAWTHGEPLEIGSLLYGAGGKPRASILYLAHLSDAERQFVVSLVLARMVTWMRAQSGTNNLRALVYMDEVVGFVPPSAEPPAKRPIMTLLKQARAYGVGVVLATQNPVDLDYKAMSNAGTWMIGRLQTERDKARILEALSSASGGVDLPAIDAAISGLGKRQFILHNTHDRGGPQRFSTRWAISYLRGPLTRQQLALLPGARSVAPAGSDSASPTPARPKADAAPAPALAEDETTVPPKVASGVEVTFVDPAAPWAAAFGAAPDGTRLRPALAATVRLRFDDATAGVNHVEEWEAILPLDEDVSPEAAVAVDFDPRDFRPTAPAGAVFRLPRGAVDTAAFFKEVERGLKASLLHSRTIQIYVNRELRLYGRAGESEEAFRERCLEVARAEADREAAKLRSVFESKMERVRAAIERAEERVAQVREDERTRKSHEVVAGVGDLLGAFLGGKASAGAIAKRLGRSATGVSSRRGQTSRTRQRLEGVQSDLERRTEELEEIEADLQDDLADLVEEWEEKAAAVEPLTLALEQDDVTVQDLKVAWIPTA
ncbi:MAG: hypothetical protein AMXMBFR23_11140 [Chloroflexota bacterium]